MEAVFTLDQRQTVFLFLQFSNSHPLEKATGLGGRIVIHTLRLQGTDVSMVPIIRTCHSPDDPSRPNTNSTVRTKVPYFLGAGPHRPDLPAVRMKRVLVVLRTHFQTNR